LLALPCAAHLGSGDPTTENWTLTAGDTGISGTPILADPEFPGVAAWQIDEGAAGTLRYERPAPNGVSWILSARLRVVDLDEPVDEGIQLEVADGSRRFQLRLGSDAQGGTLIELAGVPGQITIAALSAPGVRTDYVKIELVSSATDGLADLFVNGLEVASDYAGTVSALNRVTFGDGSTSQGGRACFADVNFRPWEAECRNGVDDDRDGLVDFASGDSDCSQPNDPTEGAPFVPCADGVDSDNDLICDVDEGLFGTTPLAPDHDDDGLNDGSEVLIRASPLDADTDDDGLLDGDEPGSNGFGVRTTIATSLLTSSVVPFDLDGDDDLDLVAAGYGEVEWYENTDGAAVYGPAQAISSSISVNSTAVGDIDGDGDGDIVIGTASPAFGGNARIVWYENTNGVGVFSSEQRIDTSSDGLGTSEIQLADLDGPRKGQGSPRRGLVVRTPNMGGAENAACFSYSRCPSESHVVFGSCRRPQ
ncbi:MAG: VCBS repeat-containing protein, partial [Gemmatimonadetes bacterium]|nr:VCBS repeat-containing protein [Gemmatimonadota bacterium]